MIHPNSILSSFNCVKTPLHNTLRLFRNKDVQTVPSKLFVYRNHKSRLRISQVPTNLRHAALSSRPKYLVRASVESEMKSSESRTVCLVNPVITFTHIFITMKPFNGM